MARALQIRLLGGFDVHVGGDRWVLRSARLESLLAFLVLNGGVPQPRQRIAFLFWPDSTEKQARTNLRNLLHRLRAALPHIDTYLDLDGRTIGWRPEAVIESDVLEFERAADAAETRSGDSGDDEIASLETAVRAYAGDLLPGAFDEWILPEQDRLRGRYASILERLVARHALDGNHDRVVECAADLLRVAPLHEAAYRHLIRAYAARGNRAQALGTYHECSDILERELGASPGAATRAEYMAALMLGEQATPVTASTERVTLVARESEWTRLLDECRNRTNGRPRLVLVSGEPGIGKTRLVEELIRWFATRGTLVAYARAYEAEGSLAYAPVVEWLRSDALRPGLSRLDRQELAHLAGLLPELAAAPAEAEQVARLSASERRRRLCEVVTQALTAPEHVLLAIDDVQWCDRETLDLFHYMVRRASRPLLIVGTVRREEVEGGHPFHALVNGLAMIDRVGEVQLTRFDRSGTAMLAEQYAGHRFESRDIDRLHEETEGNPLFIIEMLRAGWTPDAGDGPAHGWPRERLFSPRLHAVIESRLRQLSPPAREIAELAATVGREFTVDVLRHATDRDEVDLLRALDELWRRRVVRDRGRAAYDFSHDKIREATYLRVTPPRRREYHLRVARALERIHDGERESVSGTLARHYARAGLAAEAVTWYERAAVAARRVSAHEDAIGHLTGALAGLATLPEGPGRNRRELSLRLALGASLGTARGWGANEVEAAYERARELCGDVNESSEAFATLWGLYSFHLVHGTALPAARALGEQMVSIAEAKERPALLVASHFALGCTLSLMGAFSDARAHLDRSAARYDRGSHDALAPMLSSDLGVFTHCVAAHTLWHLGYPDRALARCESAVALARELSHRFSEAIAHAYTAMLHQFRREVDAAAEEARATIDLSHEYGFPYYRAWGSIIRGWARAERGDARAGIAEMRDGMARLGATGAEIRRPYYLALIAEALVGCGETREALATIEEGLDTANRTGERWRHAELHRLAGVLHARRGDDGRAEASLRRALDIAHEQHARSLALRAAVSLGELRRRQGRTLGSVGA